MRGRDGENLIAGVSSRGRQMSYFLRKKGRRKESEKEREGRKRRFLKLWKVFVSKLSANKAVCL